MAIETHITSLAVSNGSSISVSPGEVLVFVLMFLLAQTTRTDQTNKRRKAERRRAVPQGYLPRA